MLAYPTIRHFEVEENQRVKGFHPENTDKNVIMKGYELHEDVASHDDGVHLYNWYTIDDNDNLVNRITLN